MPDLENNSSVGADSVSDSNSASTAVETVSTPGTEVSQNASPSSSSSSEAEFVIPDDIAAEIDAAISEQKPSEEESKSNLFNYLRKQVASEKMKNRELSSKPPEYGDQEKYALDLLRELNGFDRETGKPTSVGFAKLVAGKGKELAIQAAWDLMQQPFDENGLTIGHKLLAERIGIPPEKLDEARRFVRGELQSNFVSNIPESVTKMGMAEAFKSLTPLEQEQIAWQLETANENYQTLAKTALQRAQNELLSNQDKTQRNQTEKDAFDRDITQTVETQELETFNTLVDSFRESPTYTKTTLSSDPTVDSTIKDAVNLMVVGLGYPDTVFGQQSQKIFQALGVNVNSDEVNTLVREISGNIETAVKAGKGGYKEQEAQALGLKTNAYNRASAMRNRIWSEAMLKLSGAMQAISQGQADKVNGNGAMPHLKGSHQGGQSDGQVDTMKLIHGLVAQAKG